MPNPDCTSCEHKEPELDPEDRLLFDLYADIQRWGFSESVFKAHGLTMDSITLEKLAIIDEAAKEKWQKSDL